MVKRVAAILAVALLLAATPVLASEAKNQIKGSIDKIISILKDKELQDPKKVYVRRDMIFKAVEERFDFAEMGKRSLGRHWKKRSAKEREEFTKTFSRLLENSYISKIERYTDEEVRFLNERTKGDNFYIYTEIVSKGKGIPVNYSLRKVEDKWMVYDVNIEGVSLVRNYMTQFSKIIKRKKFSGLMKKLEKKLKNLEEELKAKSEG